MRRLSKHSFGGLALVGILSLAACDSAEERAERHYERAAALLAEGDADRAALEFRNALQANPEHVPSLRDYAAMLRQRGDVAAASREYTRLAEIEPGDAAVQLALAELALTAQDFAAVEVYGERAYALAPDELGARAMKASIAFRKGERDLALDLARGVLEEDPANPAAHMVRIAERMADADFEQALALASAAVELAPENPDLHLAKLAAVEQVGRPEDVRAQLETMNELFPENGMVLEALLQWYADHDRNDEAIGLMREIADRTPDNAGARLRVVQTILKTKGADAARAELEALAASQSDPSPYRVALARLDFAQGRRERAIAALEALVKGEESTPAIRDIRIALASMLETVGRTEEARGIAVSVLTADARHIGALKMRARWLIDEDRTEEAMVDLRAASMEAPRDPEVMTLMAAAHEREGATELVGERLARAVEASGIGIGESLRYALFLIRQQRFPEAEGVVLDALRRDPDNRQLLVALGQIHLGRNDPVRARQVSGLLRGLGTPAGSEAATALDIAALNAQGRTEETVSLLEDVVRQDDGNLRARARLVHARLAAGDAEGARAEVDAILSEDAASIPGRLLLAGIHVSENRLDEAEPIYRAVIEANPKLVEPYRILYTLLLEAGRKEDAVALLEAGLETTDRASGLLELRAGQHYLDGEPNAAIAAYSELYERDRANVVIANNLASLLSMHRDDPDSVDRAFTVARRLRGTEVPHFQDTYGWILVLRGDHEQALTYLEPAAAAMADDPMVHFHLGTAYHALERWDEARAAFARGIGLAGADAGADAPQLATARERIKEIDALSAEARAGG